MSNWILNAGDTPLDEQGGGSLPDMSGALQGLFQNMTFTRVTKVTRAFQVVETGVDVQFRGVIQPLSDRKLLLKPEGQRAWTWWLLHAEVSLILKTDEVVLYQGVQTRVMAQKDYSAYGYVEYQLVQDYTGAGPVSA